jgi:hypothetical protein
MSTSTRERGAAAPGTVAGGRRAGPGPLTGLRNVSEDFGGEGLRGAVLAGLHVGPAYYGRCRTTFTCTRLVPAVSTGNSANEEGS